MRVFVCLLLLHFLQKVAIRHQSVFPRHVCSNIVMYCDVITFILRFTRSVKVAQFWMCTCYNTNMEEAGTDSIWLQFGSRQEHVTFSSTSPSEPCNLMSLFLQWQSGQSVTMTTRHRPSAEAKNTLSCTISAPLYVLTAWGFGRGVGAAVRK
jgi:hypothetical protein